MTTLTYPAEHSPIIRDAQGRARNCDLCETPTPATVTLHFAVWDCYLCEACAEARERRIQALQETETW